MNKSKHPFWRGFSGFLFTVCLFLAVAGYNAFRLTSFDTVKSIALPVLQELGYTSSIDDLYPQIIELARRNPDASLELPIQLRLAVKGKDLIGLSRAEMKDYLIISLLKAVYFHPENLKILESEKEKLGSLATLSDIFNQDTHERIRVYTLILLAASLIFLFPFLYLTLGYAKLSSLGASLLVVSLPAFASLYAARISLERILAQNGVALESVIGNLRSLIFEIQMSYAVLLAAGLLLLFSGWATSLIFKPEK